MGEINGNHLSIDIEMQSCKVEKCMREVKDFTEYSMTSRHKGNKGL